MHAVSVCLHVCVCLCSTHRVLSEQQAAYRTEVSSLKQLLEEREAALQAAVAAAAASARERDARLIAEREERDAALRAVESQLREAERLRDEAVKEAQQVRRAHVSVTQAYVRHRGNDILQNRGLHVVFKAHKGCSLRPRLCYAYVCPAQPYSSTALLPDGSADTLERVG